MRESRIKQTDPDRNYRRVMAASTLNGDSVRNAAGEDLGKVDEIMLDIPSGRIAYAVLSFGGMLGMGTDYYPLPWESLTYDTDRRGYVVDIDKDTLKNAPHYGADDEPAYDAAYEKSVYGHYGLSYPPG